MLYERFFFSAVVTKMAGGSFFSFCNLWFASLCALLILVFSFFFCFLYV